MKQRTYQLKQRAERKAATRERIVEATLALHTSVGPGKTTISAIAERAGVQRQTVYAHFPDEDTLFGACTGLWAARHPFPDPALWGSPEDPGRRLQAALTDIYGWYAGVADQLALFRRDAGTIPPAVVARQEEQDRWLAAELTHGFPKQAPIVVAVAHVLEFETWLSLHRKGLSAGEAAALMRRFVTCLQE